ncbi:MAG: thioredoxin domain-containing protein [Caldilineales bacterium]|nr:thioredoxin domain-containing protein [Caldilineales bacterium]
MIDEYVRNGIARLQFWHILDHADTSVQASAAAECAGEQGAFWRMHDALFENQNDLWGGDVQTHVVLATNLGLDAEAFRLCMETGKKQQRAREIDNQVKAAGVRIRPSFDVNGQRIQGSPPLDQWRELLDGVLNG